MSDIFHKIKAVDVDNDGDNGTHKEMALGILSKRLGDKKVWAIPLSNAWRYNEIDYLANACGDIALFLQLNTDVWTLQRIANLILDFLPDLIASKPVAELEGDERGEGKIIINDSKTSYFGITNNGIFIQ